MDAPSGSLIVYATAPGSVAADGAAYGFWSSETVGFFRARVVSFDDGNVFNNSSINCLYFGVRAVRSGQY